MEFIVLAFSDVMELIFKFSCYPILKLLIGDLHIPTCLMGYGQ